jgi:hypothetical protein
MTPRDTGAVPPTDYDEFDTALEAQLVNTARFVPAAFHIHSPHSPATARRPGTHRVG